MDKNMFFVRFGHFFKKNSKSQDHFRPAEKKVDKNMFFVRFGHLEIFLKKKIFFKNMMKKFEIFLKIMKKKFPKKYNLVKL